MGYFSSNSSFLNCSFSFSVIIILSLRSNLAGCAWGIRVSAAPVHNYNTAAIGTYNDASFLGGNAVSGGAVSNVHQHWNGSGWTTRTVMPVSGGTGMGANNAPTSNFWVQVTNDDTLVWDGSSWTTTGSLSTARVNGGSGGTSSAEGFVTGGNQPPGPNIRNETEEFSLGPITKTITVS